MKKLTNPTFLPTLAATAGLAGAVARWALYLWGTDSSGLLISNHPLQIVCWGLAVTVAVFAGTLLYNIEPIDDYAANFPKNKHVQSMAILAAAGIAITAATELDFTNRLQLIRSALGFCSAIGLVITGQNRRAGKQPKYYLYGILCLFYAAHMICCYQSWSANPQVEDYCFALLACACLTISAYQRAAFSVGLGHRRSHLFFCLMAGFFGILCAPGSASPALYLTGSCFFLTDLRMTLPGEEPT